MQSGTLIVGRTAMAPEIEACAKNGVTEIVEIKVGFDGLTVAASKDAPDMKLTKQQLFMALAKQVPDKDGKLVDNPYKMWNEIDPSLPAQKIEVLGPPPTSGTRDAFLELAMEAGAKKFEMLNKLSKDDGKKFTAIAHTIREDGAYIDAGENDNLIVQKLDSNPNAVGIFGFSFLDQNLDKVHGASVEGAPPEFDSIASGKYPLSRPLFFYVKKAHVGVIPGIKEFLAEFTSEKAWGKDGYLSEKGLIPMPDAERKQVAENVKAMKTVTSAK